MKLVNITIDGKELQVLANKTILEVAKENGFNIPTLCHHPDIPASGACGLCVVEIEGSPTPNVLALHRYPKV
jgi:NADH dehydrogenase/NADH:ubiquinone oxidoreductase subunit G